MRAASTIGAEIQNLKRTLVHLAKLAFSFGLLVYLAHGVHQDDPDVFRRLITEPKRWSALMVAWICFVAAWLCGLGRWHVLVRAVGLRWRRRDTLRTGLAAYMLDFAAVGALGGDLFKALAVRGRNPGRAVEALTTVVADRLIGLFGLITFSAFWFWYLDARTMSGVLALIAPWVPWVVAAAGAAGLAFLTLGGTAPGIARSVEPVRLIGPHLANLFRVAAQYRQRLRALAQALCATLLLLCLNATGYTLLAIGLPGAGPTLIEHCLIVPLASLSGLVPLPADALGVLDLAVSHLYEHVTAGRVTAGAGMLAVMAYRCVGLTLTALGLVYFSAAPGGVRQALRDVLGRDDGRVAGRRQP